MLFNDNASATIRYSSCVKSLLLEKLFVQQQFAFHSDSKCVFVSYISVGIHWIPDNYTRRNIQILD